MSAQIPSTMLLSDLLKATGYDCPEELQGRTFAEATAGGDVQTNKASTIDVSAYTEPIVIKPDTDYESMKKATITLSNIPQTKTEIALEATENKTYTPEEGKVFNSVTVNVPVGATKLYAWTNSTLKITAYTSSAEPTTSDKAAVIAGGSNETKRLSAAIAIVSVADQSITLDGYDTYPFTRYADYDRDITF